VLAHAHAHIQILHNSFDCNIFSTFSIVILIRPIHMCIHINTKRDDHPIVFSVQIHMYTSKIWQRRYTYMNIYECNIYMYIHMYLDSICVGPRRRRSSCTPATGSFSLSKVQVATSISHWMGASGKPSRSRLWPLCKFAGGGKIHPLVAPPSESRISIEN